MDGRARSASSIQPSARGTHRRAAKSPAELTNDLTKLLAKAASVATPPPPTAAPLVPPGRHHADQPPPVDRPPPPRFRITRTQVIVAAAVAAAALVVVPLLLVWTPGENAEGTTVFPPSRGYACRAGNLFREISAACRAAAAVRPATDDDPDAGLGDGADIGIPDVGNRHQEIIPDTRLCSAGRERYRGLDLARPDWPPTELTSGATTTFVYRLDDQHDGRLRFFLTRAGYDPTRALIWADLDTKPIAQATGKPGADNTYRVAVKLPARSGRHLVYTIWESADSDAALYACSDVNFVPPNKNNTTADEAEPTASTAPTTPSRPAPDPAASSPTPSSDGSSGSDTVSDWRTGVAYDVGDQVKYDGVTYRCLQPHESIPGWDPDSAPGFWELAN